MMYRLFSSLTAGVLAAGLAAGSASAQTGGALPSYLRGLVAPTTSTPAANATRDVLQLNVSMFALYDAAARIFQANIMANHPMILALFSGAGGRMILYRPGKPPEEAPSVPMVYQVLKSTGHSTMAISEVVLPFVNNANDKSWMAPLLAYRTQMKTAVDGLKDVPMQDDWKSTVREILSNNVAFMDDCLAKGMIAMEAVEAFAKKQAPHIKVIVNAAASTQVKHWMTVLDGWKASLGDDWNKVYAAANTIYVARQNNVLFSTLAQYFPPEAINDRLLLIETISFTTTPQDMLTSLTRIISDRAVGGLFFGQDRLMDFELMGGDARKTIVSEMQKRGKQAFLPPWVPFGSHQWPALITPGPGPTSLDDLK